MLQVLKKLTSQKIAFQIAAPIHTAAQKEESLLKEMPDEIVPRVLLGNGTYGDDCLREIVGNKRADLCILRCTKHRLPPEIAQEEIEQLKLRQLKIVDVGDVAGEQLVPYFDACFEFIEQALAQNKTVLVHCDAGVSRSPTFVTAYLIRRYGLSAEHALNHVMNSRPIVDIQPTFRMQLEAYAQQLQEMYADEPIGAAAPQPLPKSEEKSLAEEQEAADPPPVYAASGSQQ